MSSLRLGINALFLIPGGVGGTEIYLRSLLSALREVDKQNEYYVYVNQETGFENLPGLPGFHIVRCGIRATFRPGRLIYEQVVLPLLLKRDRIEVLLNPGFTGPVFFNRPSVSVFHDLQHKRYPRFFRWFELPFWNLALWLSVLRSRCLIAVSDATAEDLALFYPDASNKIAIVPHGVDPEFFYIGERRRSRREPKDKYILTVSTLHPHKNIHRLLEAFHLFRVKHPEFRLVVAGLKGFAAQELESARRTLDLVDSVTFTGWIPRDELFTLYEHADSYLAPSEFEGFGMPIIEALAAGIPSACSAIAPFLSITGSAAVHFNPGSTSEIAGAMEFLTTDAAYRETSATSGPRQARLFDWNKSAMLTLRQLEDAAREWREPKNRRPRAKRTDGPAKNAVTQSEDHNSAL